MNNNNNSIGLVILIIIGILILDFLGIGLVIWLLSLLIGALSFSWKLVAIFWLVRCLIWILCPGLGTTQRQIKIQKSDD